MKVSHSPYDSVIPTEVEESLTFLCFRGLPAKNKRCLPAFVPHSRDSGAAGGFRST